MNYRNSLPPLPAYRKKEEKKGRKGGIKVPPLFTERRYSNLAEMREE